MRIGRRYVRGVNGDGFFVLVAVMEIADYYYKIVLNYEEDCWRTYAKGRMSNI